MFASLKHETNSFFLWFLRTFFLLFFNCCCIYHSFQLNTSFHTFFVTFSLIIHRNRENETFLDERCWATERESNLSHTNESYLTKYSFQHRTRLFTNTLARGSLCCTQLKFISVYLKLKERGEKERKLIRRKDKWQICWCDLA